MTTIDDIERLAAGLAAARRDLEADVRREERELAAVTQKFAPGLRRHKRFVLAAFDALHAAVDANRHLFKSPKTRTLHDIRLGLMKGKGRLSWDDEAKVIARIKRLWEPEDAAPLIKTTETLSRTALAALPAKDLKVLGVSVVDSEDEVVVKPAPSPVEKRIAALLAGDE